MTVPINPEVLRWARKSRVLTIQEAAKRLEWSVDRLEALEHAAEISVDDLDRIATKYRVSTATLLMPEPLPADRYPPRAIGDFRLHAHAEEEPLSVKTQTYVENAFELIELLDEINDADQDLAARPLLPFCELVDDAGRAASRERGRIGAAVEVQLGWETDKEAFLRWREIIEAQEIFTHKLAMSEKYVRGFAIYQKGYGLIGINSNDDYRARIFTLFHEYAHILLRTGGISDQNRQVPIERWCNQFAANFLMPAAAFLHQFRLMFPDGEASDWSVGRMAKLFKVSKAATAIRFEELELAAVGFYDRLQAEWKLPPKRKGGSGTDSVDVDLGRYGTTHVGVISQALQRGVIDPLEAQYALNVPPRNLTALTAAARARHLAYGPAR